MLCRGLRVRALVAIGSVVAILRSTMSVCLEVPVLSELKKSTDPFCLAVLLAILPGPLQEAF